MKVAIFTGNRADYGILYPLIKRLVANNIFDVKLIASGSHLSPYFGNTVADIKSEFPDTLLIETLLASDSKISVSKTMGLTILGSADVLDNMKPDLLIILGDRYEALAMASSAAVLRIKIFHLHGGEITLGAIDNELRNAISMLSFLHGTATEKSRQRLIAMGVQPSLVVNFGSIAVESLAKASFLTRNELASKLSYELQKDFVLLTIHPATNTNENPALIIQWILEVMFEETSLNIIATFPNADDGNNSIIEKLLFFQNRERHRLKIVKSLGNELYFSTLKHCKFTIGNSSSGIIEAPALKTISINIGDRQKGRESADSIIHSEPEKNKIRNAIFKAINETENEELNFKTPYQKNDTLNNIEKFLIANKNKLTKNI